MKIFKSKKFLATIAIVLMMGIIAGMGAMTYSKYVTSADGGTQTATAAKWGFVISVDASKLFGSDYKKDGSNASAKIDGSGNVVVNGSGDAVVVAPGTEGSMTITVNGSAEVLAKLTVNATTTSDIHLDSYYPVNWTVSDGATTSTSNTLAEAVAALNKTTTINVGDTTDKTYTLSWKWALDGADDTANTKDTIIGYKANGKTYDELKGIYGETALASIISETDYNNTEKLQTQMSFSLTVTVEQTQG